MRITGAKVYGADLRFHEDVDIQIQNGIITDLSNRGDAAEASISNKEEVIDATGCLAIPGLIDIHFHGAMGYDVCDASIEAYEEIAQYEARQGVTAICPATLTLPVPELERVLSLGAAFAASEESNRGIPCMGSETYADLVGFNMEGPFISHAKKGAQNEAYIRPCYVQDVENFLDASDGLVKIIGLAPEENENFIEYIQAVKDRVTVSLAHTNADYETASRAIEAGAGHAVHLYNAMSGLSHRDPGVVGAVSDANDPEKIQANGHPVYTEIICDGIHVHEAAVRAAMKMNGSDHMILVSDSLRSTGMPDGEYQLGGQTVVKKGRFCTLKENGNLAGSVTNLLECMVNAVQNMGIPLETAIACATMNPARAIHVDDKYGSIEPGKNGNIVLLNREDLSLVAVIKDGIRL